MKHILPKLSLVALTFAFGTNASVITLTDTNNVTSNGNCSTSSVQITQIVENLGGGNTGDTVFTTDNDPATDDALHATKCLGYITSPHNDWGNLNKDYDPSTDTLANNNGALGEGLLNQEANKDGNYIGGSFFLDHPNDSLVDLNNDGTADDPGWIRLGGIGDYDDGATFEYEYINGFNLSQVINFVLSGNNNGNWSLSVDPAAIPAATNALGRPTVFDHLAFVIKGPNPKSGEDTSGWAIYDFNFYDLIDGGLDISLGDTAYNFEGTWDYNAVSHFSIWAHDPPAAETTSVPEPSSLLILSSGLLMMTLRRIKRS
ncbi:PEP-CTERM sorting domain-containing protein [Thalassotalea sp. LPB0316]|uniref:PEP-CTERM sorting domain-containing protein n=1 Tax=Thalassotalea sp. LPB0316 TaxID=2769490 RepID=UPI00186870EF|nr:PEP-CTERM sorting domain-containing protein [Thalassotalea sp. LPB0316]QOL26868.1 PEP-CTERM sorting domain-containing protein [Thalassotalea sp. LPB0316]